MDVTTTKTQTWAAFWRALPREGKLLLFVVVIEFIGTGLVLPFNVIYLHEVRGFSLGDTGWLLAIPAITSLLLVGPAGYFIDRVGARRVLLTASCAAPLGQLTVAWAHTVPTAAIGLAVSGFALGVAHPSTVSLAATIVGSENRPRFFGIQFALLNLGIGLGGIIGGFSVDVSKAATFVTIYVVDAISYLPAIALLLWPLRHVGQRAEQPEAEDDRAGSYLAVLRRPAVVPMCAVSFLIAFIGYGQLNSGMPAFARAVSEVSPQGLGIAFAANSVVIVALQLLVLKHVEMHRRTRIIAVMGLTWAVSWGLLAASGLVPGTLGATILLTACTSVFALGETLLQPTIPAILNDLAPDHLRGRHNALNVMCIQGAAALGPPVAGALLGANLTLVYVAVLIGGALVAGLVSVVVLEPRLPPGTNGGVASPNLVEGPAVQLETATEGRRD